jgi:hypothetical protein
MPVYTMPCPVCKEGVIRITTSYEYHPEVDASEELTDSIECDNNCDLPDDLDTSAMELEDEAEYDLDDDIVADDRYVPRQEYDPIRWE